jgi:hypothetical protein
VQSLAHEKQEINTNFYFSLQIILKLDKIRLLYKRRPFYKKLGGVKMDGNDFYAEVCKMYQIVFQMYAEVKIKSGKLSIGDTVYVYDEKRRFKYDKITVNALTDGRGLKVSTIKAEDEYAAISFEGYQKMGDFLRNDIISGKKLETVAPVTEKVLPIAKTYNNADFRIHVTMAVNDLVGCPLSSSRNWVRNVGEDLYNAHGMEAMQEVFNIIKARSPEKQGELSDIWNGIGDWTI